MILFVICIICICNKYVELEQILA